MPAVVNGDAVGLILARWSRRSVFGALLASALSGADTVGSDAKRKKKKKKKTKKCPGGSTMCAGQCVASQSDPNNCGGCGTVCPTRMSCVEGRCALRVCPTCTYSTLQAAVNAASSGDTIRMDAGTYTDLTYIDRNVQILGSGRPAPFPVVGPGTIIKGTDRTAITIAADVTVRLANLMITEVRTFSHGGAITIFARSNVEIANCWLYKNYADYGAGIDNSGNLNLVDSIISFGQARKLGGGIFNSRVGRLTLTRSQIYNNTALGDGGYDEWGGGVFNHIYQSERGTVSNQGSTVAYNSPDQCAYTSAC